MATYYNGGSEIQADGLQTLYLMNPNYAGYSDTQQQQQPTNMFFLNSAAAGNALTAASVSHAPPPQSQHLVGIPLPTNSEDPRRPIPVHEIPSLQGILPRFHYNLWGTADQTAAADNHPHVATTVAASCSDQWSSLNLRPVVSPTTQQGLSLTLSSRQPGFRSLSGENDNSGKAPATGSGGSSAVTNGISGVQSVILGSKYLKAAQLLLDEVVNVGKAIKADSGEGSKEKNKMDKESAAASGGDGSSGGESSSKRATELTTAQRQEFQMKKAKLVNMLDEVEQRYRQYHHQMQIVVSSFEQAAGLGSAKSYTALALQTISKQFRCLKDAIASQIKATSRSLGEDIDHHSMGSAGKVEGSRLKFVDHQLRQQRAMQQLGMIQHNAWRPQRGLPERAVSVLRAWLFEHFLHPYPKDSDKHILAKQTGLTRSQVSNWFINARVRLWKPMVEEMYLEEVKDQAEQTGSDHNKDSGSKSSPDPQENSPSFQINQSKNTLISKQERLIQEMEGIVQRSPKKPRSYDKQSSSSSILSTETDTKTKPAAETTRGMVENFGIQRQTRGNYSLMEDTTSHGNGFGAYPIADIGRFDPEELVNRFNGNGVSLTLGLPHCENASQQNFLSNQNIGQLGNRVGIGSVETHYIGVNTPQPSLSDVGYDNISIQNRKIFAAQLLHDFVA